MGDCDAACVKIIINSGLVAPLADRLASSIMAQRSTVLIDLRELAEDARTLVAIHESLVDHGVIPSVQPAVWDGCSDAETLTTWLTLGIPSTAAETIKRIRSGIWQQVAELVGQRS
jgi:hypothetical protein